MPLIVYLGAGALIGAVVALMWSVSGARQPGKLVQANLALGGPSAYDMRQIDLARSTQERVVRPFVALLARRARRLTPAGMLRALERRVDLAGISMRWPIERVLAAKLLLGAAGALMGAARLLTDTSLFNVGVLLFLAVIAFCLPDAVMARMAEARQEVITRELPDTIDQVTVSVEAGLGFEASLARVARVGKGPLAAEIGRMLQDVQVGVPRGEALQRMVQRTDVSDLRHFVLAIRQAEQYGMPITQVLRVQAAESRTKRRQRAEEHAQKIPVKLVFPLVLCIMPPLFIVLAGPAAMRISNTNFGG